MLQGIPGLDGIDGINGADGLAGLDGDVGEIVSENSGIHPYYTCDSLIHRCIVAIFILVLLPYSYMC